MENIDPTAELAFLFVSSNTLASSLEKALIIAKLFYSLPHQVGQGQRLDQSMPPFSCGWCPPRPVVPMSLSQQENLSVGATA